MQNLPEPQRKALLGVFAGVALVAMGWSAYVNLFAPPPDPSTAKVMSPDDMEKIVADMARRSGGDINRLSAEERKTLSRIAGNEGAFLMRRILEQEQGAN